MKKMFSNLLQKIETKRMQIETKNIQSQCPHEWHVVSEYRYMDFYYNYRDVCDLYCPICKKERNRVEDRIANKILEKQRIQKEYEESDFNGR